MRVTNNMISNTVAFNTSRAIARFLDMQSQMSSGRRINQPSDDPVGTIKDLDYRAELAKNLQYRNAVDQGLNWMGTYENDLNDIGNMLSSARELAVAIKQMYVQFRFHRPAPDMFENNYQAALMAGAKIVQPTLLDFLR